MIYFWAILLTLLVVGITLGIVAWWEFYQEYGDSHAYLIIIFIMLAALIAVMCAAPGVIKQTPIKTEVLPTIDTLVFTKNGVGDTTYVYHFDFGGKKECE